MLLAVAAPTFFGPGSGRLSKCTLHVTTRFAIWKSYDLQQCNLKRKGLSNKSFKLSPGLLPASALRPPDTHSACTVATRSIISIRFSYTVHTVYTQCQIGIRELRYLQRAYPDAGLLDCNQSDSLCNLARTSPCWHHNT